ncbi:MAG: redoxin domain-containing protein [Pseudomonadota bacterium]
MKKPLIFAAAAVIGLAGGLYLALSGRESPQDVPQLDLTAYEAMREGDMLKLQVGTNRGSTVPFLHEDGETELTLADYEGKWVVLNFWATWCAPCRKEMPHLSELQTEFGGGDFEVVTIASGPNQRPAMERFLAEIGVDNLPLHTDANSAFTRDMGVVGLPVTIVMHPDGYEVARLIGDADWASDNAKEILQAMMAGL